MSEKSIVRKALRARRDSIEPAERYRLDKEITRLITESCYYRCAEQILVFISCGSEFDTHDIIEKSLTDGKAVYAPRCRDGDGQMDFFKISGSNDLCKGMYGIWEPREGAVPYSPLKNDLAVVPALSVDSSFIRIGYGKGYYDRFLKGFRSTSICPCYEAMRSRALPADEFDVKINLVATETGLYKREVIL